MTHVKLTKAFRVTGESDIDAHTDAVMDELMALEECTEGLSDADLTAALTDRIVEISIVAVADDFDTALAIADSAIRTAIHGAGGHTPEWEAPVFSTQSSTADLVDA